MNDMIKTTTNLPATESDIFSLDNLADLTEGVAGGFGILGFRGGKWRIKYSGDETLVTDNNDEPVASVPVVLVKAAPNVSKIFYNKRYEEGDAEAPDCYSLNGETPDPQAPDPQATKCATCPQNQFGSRVTDSGKKAKACSDHRRVAVVPAGRSGAEASSEIMQNEQFGGPMLLRIPTMSLRDMVKYAGLLKNKHGKNYNEIVTLLSFDTDVAYPKLMFKAIRRLTDEERAQVISFYGDGSLDNVLNTTTDMAAAAPKVEAKKTVDVDFEEDMDEEPEVVAKPAPKPKPKKAAKAKGNGKAKPEPEPELELEAAPEGNDLEGAIDGIVDELDF